MATLVRCIEGHAFDRAASETCPICGSTVWKNETVKKSIKEPVYEKKPPLDRTKIIELAVVAASIIFSLAMIFAIALGIGQLMPEGGIKSAIPGIKSAIYDYWQRVEAPERAKAARALEHACEERRLHDPNVVCSFREAERDKAAREREHSCEERKLHDPNVVCSFRAVAPKPENPFVPQSENILTPKPGISFDPSIRFDPK
jgi:hypothetical protein